MGIQRILDRNQQRDGSSTKHADRLGNLKPVCALALDLFQLDTLTPTLGDKITKL